MPPSAKAKQTEAFYYEINRRMDEATAIIKYSCTLFGKKYQLKEQLAEINAFYKSKWFWGIFIFSFILNFILSDSTLFESKWTWNFGSGLMVYCWVLLMSKVFIGQFVEFQIKSNHEKLQELAFKFDVATTCGSELWKLEKFINTYGEIEFDEDDTIDSPYFIWLKEIRERLELRVDCYSRKY